ncbi:MAG: FtsX-like permease family protein [bacterium]|nr:FtsX-like permease family protein [bacterium]
MMLEKFRFYIKHSINDLRVNGQRTFFAILCIAAGVAAIVSLQTLSVMIQDTLTGNLRETNKGDIRFDNDIRLRDISFDNPEEFNSSDFQDIVASIEKEAVDSGVLEEIADTSFFPGAPTTKYFGVRGREILAEWADANIDQPVTFTYLYQVTDAIRVFTGLGAGTVLDLGRTELQSSQVTPFMIDSANYPLVGEIRSNDGKSLDELFPTPNSVVISQNVADNLQAQVGDTVRLSGIDTDFTITGIVATEKEAGLTNPFAGIFGFYYVDKSAMSLFGIEDRVEEVYMILENPNDELIAEISEKLESDFGFLDFNTTLDVAEVNEQIAGVINQLVTVMGLISLLLGSIGIVNTMQVVVRRRTLEVAVLKTLGLQANQVTMLFLVQAFIMGILGSLFGILLGWGMTFFIRGSAETFLGQSLPFRITPTPAITGLIVGTLVTTVFGFLPTLSAGQVRPGIVLRPNDDILPRTGLLRSFGALLIVVFALTLIAAGILGNLSAAFGVVSGTFFAAGFFYLLLLLLLWIIGKFFPSFGWVDLRLSLKAVLVGRRRGAFTLLALVVGVFSLSLITLLADSVNRVISDLTSTGIGGNVIIQMAGAGASERVETILKDQTGVNSYTLTRTFPMELISVTKVDGTVQTADEINSIIISNSGNINALDNLFQRTSGRDVPNNLPNVTFNAGNGRQLTAEDAGQAVIVMPRNESVDASGLAVGDVITVRVADTKEISFTLVGLSEPPTVVTDPPAPYAPVGAFEGVQPISVGVIVDIEEENVPDLRSSLSKVGGVFMLETKVLNTFINAILGQITAFPILVATLSLIVGGVVIANSVALSTIERRKEIAVMKTVGVHRERVLGMLLLENAIMGFVGGLLGVGIGLIGLVISLQGFPGASSIIPYGTALLLMLMCVAIALVAAVTTAWGASGEKPLNVLRYE